MRLLWVELAFGQWILVLEQSSELFECWTFGFWIQKPDDGGFDGQPYDVYNVKSTITLALFLVTNDTGMTYFQPMFWMPIGLTNLA